MAAIDLFSATNKVEVPFIKVTIAGYTFGVYNKTSSKLQTTNLYSYKSSKIDFPNFISSLNVVKNANGTVNVYTLNLVHAVQVGEDPNLIEKILSKSKAEKRRITFSYGDYNFINFIYKEEEAIITDYKAKVSVSSGVINYTIKATSNTVSQVSTAYSFPKHDSIKPSSVIKSLLLDKKYGLTSMFYGMSSAEAVNACKLIADDDVPVKLESKSKITVLDYIRYLVDSMRWVNDKENLIKSCTYKMAIYDTVYLDENITFEGTSRIITGPYFRVSRIKLENELSKDMTYAEIDVGYPGQGNVVSFDVNDSEGFAIIYDYKGSVDINQYQYILDDAGNIKKESSSDAFNRRNNEELKEADKTWWTNVTSYPLTATLRVRGLLRNIELLSQINLYVMFYGRQHLYSGVYLVNAVTDDIGASGFRTTLSLIRTGGLPQ